MFLFFHVRNVQNHKFTIFVKEGLNKKNKKSYGIFIKILYYRLQLCPQQCVNSYFRPQQAMLWAKVVIYENSYSHNIMCE